jgi:hypothetical protein
MAKRMLYGTIEPLRMIINAIIHSQTSRRDLLCRQKVYSKPMKRCLADSICTTTPSRYPLHLPCKQAIMTCSLALSEFPPPLTSVSLPQVPMFVSYECSQPMLFKSVPDVPVTRLGRSRTIQKCYNLQLVERKKSMTHEVSGLNAYAMTLNPRDPKNP